MKKQFFGYAMIAFAMVFANSAMAGYSRVELNSGSAYLDSCGGSVSATYIWGSRNINFSINGTNNCAFVDLDGETYRLFDLGGNQYRSGSVSLPTRELHYGMNEITVRVHSKSEKHSDTIVLWVNKQVPSYGGNYGGGYNRGGSYGCEDAARNIARGQGYYGRPDYSGRSNSGNLKYQVSGLGTIILRDNCALVDIQRGRYVDSGAVPSNGEAAADANALL